MEAEVDMPLWKRGFNSNNELLDPLDIISQNPIHVLQHILTFLPEEDAARISVLSRKWGRVWCQSLLKLCLTKHRLDDQIIQTMLDTNFYGVEDLILKECIGLTNLRLSSYKLKKIVLFWCQGLEKAEIVAPNLETFIYYGFASLPCEIELSVSKHLKHLKLFRLQLVNNLLENCISDFPVLRHLTLGKCDMLDKINISSHSLYELALIRCCSLVEVRVDTPNLKIFHYSSGGSIVSLLPTSSLRLFETVITLFDLDTSDALWFHKWTRFLVNFKDCYQMIWHTNTYQNVIISEELRESLVPPLYGVTDMQVHLKSSSVKVVALVDYVLWCAPRLESLVIRWSCGEKRMLLTQDLVIEYSGYPCCQNRLVKCWRHTLVEVVMDMHDDNEARDLKDYFLRNAKDVGRSLEILTIAETMSDIEEVEEMEE